MQKVGHIKRLCPPPPGRRRRARRTASETGRIGPTASWPPHAVPACQAPSGGGTRPSAPRGRACAPLAPAGTAAHCHARAARRARATALSLRGVAGQKISRRRRPTLPMRSRQCACSPALFPHSARCTAGPTCLPFLPFLSFPPSPCPAGRRGQGSRGPYGFGRRPHDLQAFWSLFAAGRPETGAAAGSSACARGAAIRGEYARPSNPALGAHVPAFQSRPCRACRPRRDYRNAHPVGRVPKQALSRLPPAWHRAPPAGAALPSKIGRSFPHGGAAPV